MVWRSAPLRADRVTLAAKSDLGGEKENLTFRKVNICPDASGWTLLAWRGLKVMPRFIAGDAMPLL